MKDREYKRVMAFVKDGIRSGEFRGRQQAANRT